MSSPQSPPLAVGRRISRAPSIGSALPQTAAPASYSDYASFVNRLLAKHALGDAYAGFARLLDGGASTAAARFAYARDTLSRHGMVPAAVHSDEVRRATVYDDRAAHETRNRGNEHYKAGRYRRALDLYTECMLITDPGHECLALALANRAAALYRLGEYRLCLDDTRRALRAGHPARHRMHERAGNAERMLGHGDAARRHYAECLKLVGEPSAGEDAETRQLRARVQDAVEQCRGLPPSVRRRDRQRPPPPPRSATVVPDPADQLLGGRNDEIPAFSRYLELGPPKTDKPRGVYATCDINPGDVVAVEDPYLSGPCPYYNSVCHYASCLKMSIAIIPCPKCSLAYYCNEVCLQKAFEDGHNIECPIMFSVGMIPGNPNLNQIAMKWFIKECSKMGIEEYCSVLSKLDETNSKVEGFNKNSQFKSGHFLTAYSMRTSVNRTSLDVLFFFNCVAVEILEYLILSGFKIPKHCINIVGASLVHMLDILDTNCRKLFVNNPSLEFTLYKELSFPIAYALYPSIGLFNHSCDPNIKRCGLLSDKTRIMRAIRPIPKGTQLLFSYGVVFNLDIKDTRLSYCMDNFKFKCTCQPCLEDWPVDRFTADRISSLNLINQKMADIVTSECKKFIEFQDTTEPDDYPKHLSYLYSFNKFIFANVKRPFKLYEDCLFMIYTALIDSSKDDPKLFSQVFYEI